MGLGISNLLVFGRYEALPIRQKHNKVMSARRNRRRVAGLCYDCGRNPVTAGKTMCTVCSTYHKNKAKKLYHLRKQQSLCVRCGETKERERSGLTLCEICAYKRLVNA